jgi:hypothetical protein
MKKNIVLLTSSTTNEISSIKNKIQFYFNDIDSITVINSISFSDVFSNNVILVYNFNLPSYLIFKYSNFFIVDPEVNPLDGWDWHRALNLYNGLDVTGVKHNKIAQIIIFIISSLRKTRVLSIFGMAIQFLFKKSEHFFDFNDDIVNKSQSLFLDLKFKLINDLKLNKIYLFGTGPSLSNAINFHWNDGIRLVCNTIVKNKVLWNHINPNIIVAGDAIYHFGISKFSKQFRNDLKLRLAETDTYFIYPIEFHSFLSKRFSEFKDKLIPIPVQNKYSFNYSFEKSFTLQQLGNSLNLLSLPVAKNLSKEINLWGYDGKSPNDNDFWKNSNENFYQELVDDIKLIHPAFFKYFLNDQKKYAKDFFGIKLEKNLTNLESKNYTISMLHKSWTKPLNKRFNEKK